MKGGDDMGTEAARSDAWSRFAAMNGRFEDPVEINRILEVGMREANLVSPATACSQLHESFAVSVAIIWFDMDRDAHPTSRHDDPTKRRYGLLKHALMRLSSAAGLSWDHRSSGRVDNQTHPHYVHWTSVTALRDLDNNIVLSEPGDKVMDLRGEFDPRNPFSCSPQVRRIYANASRDGNPDKQLLDMRSFIVEHAQTKSELRAIRKGLHLPPNYSYYDFDRPWMVVRLVYTGKSRDPIQQRENNAAIRATFLGGAAALFGVPTAAPLLPAASTLPRLPPPPLSEAIDDEDDDVVNAPQAPASEPRAVAREAVRDARPRSTPPPARGPSDAGWTGPVTRGGGRNQARPARGPARIFTLPGGPRFGTPIKQANDNDLTYWEERLANNLKAGTARRPAEDAELLEEIRKEIDFRLGKGGNEPTDGGVGPNGRY